ncbi:LysR family transcriptional regulator [Pseudomonas sp. NFX224]|uniref:LysR family transcriptional regulator n=1 Tax=Pseudomonas sp. NFX224 TaxID=3402862 RepID=UPI003AFB4E25
MPGSRIKTFEGNDLRELLTFLVIYQERGVVKASKRLGVGQPAVSNTLSNLRCRFDDVLFTMPNCQPTSKSHRMAEILFPAMDCLQKAIDEVQHLRAD